MVANVLQTEAWMGPSLRGQTEQMVLVTALPLYHIFSLQGCLTFMQLGAHNVLIANPRDFPGFVKELGKYRFTFFTGVNTLFNALLNTPGFDRARFQRAQGQPRRRHGGAARRRRTLEAGHRQHADRRPGA